MKASNTKSKRKSKNEKQAELKVRDLVPKKDTRGGEGSLSYGGIKYDYKQQ
jgi:hypothetical protein